MEGEGGSAGVFAFYILQFTFLNSTRSKKVFDFQEIIATPRQQTPTDPNVLVELPQIDYGGRIS